jgi:phage gpG-like protein
MIDMKVDFTGADKKMQALFRLEGATKKQLTTALGQTIKHTQRNVTNSILRVRTGHLKRNIGGHVSETTPGIFETSIGTGNLIGRTEVIYASVHEFGATITPKHGKWLRFPIMGRGQVFTKGFLATGGGKATRTVRSANWVTVAKVVIPARHWLSRSIQESEGYFRSALAPRQMLHEMGWPDFEAGGD